MTLTFIHPHAAFVDEFTKPAIVPMEEAFRVFQIFAQDGADAVSFREIIDSLATPQHLNDLVPGALHKWFYGRIHGKTHGNGRREIYATMFGQMEPLDTKTVTDQDFVLMFSGKALSLRAKAGGRFGAANKWQIMSHRIFGSPRWKRLCARLQLEHAAMFSIKGINRLRHSTTRACDLALEFVALIQTPRLTFGRGDDLRVVGILAKIAFLRFYSGPAREQQLEAVYASASTLLRTYYGTSPLS